MKKNIIVGILVILLTCCLAACDPGDGGDSGGSSATGTPTVAEQLARAAEEALAAAQKAAEEKAADGVAEIKNDPCYGLKEAALCAVNSVGDAAVEAAKNSPGGYTPQGDQFNKALSNTEGFNKIKEVFWGK